MDESSPLTEPRPEQTDNAPATPHDAAIGEAKPTTPRNVSRVITSKRVVIPASAKKSAHVPPAPVAAPVADSPAVALEPEPLPGAPVVAAVTTTSAESDTLTLPPPTYSPASSSELMPEPVAPKAGSTPDAGSIKPGGMPYTTTPANLTPLPIVETPRKRRTMKWLLWLGAAVLLIIIAVAILRLLFPNLAPVGFPTR